MAVAVAVALSVVVLPPPLAAQQRVPSSAAMLADAQRHFEAGRHAEVIEQLRTLRLRHPEAPELAPALLLAGRSALAMDSGYQARYLLGQALSAGGEGGSAGRVMREAATLLAELLTEQRDYCGALIHTEQALAVALRSPQPTGVASLHLEASRLSLHHTPTAGCDALSALGLHGLSARDRALWHLDRVGVAELASAERDTHRALARTLMWTHLPASVLGLVDGSVSALTIDRDDLWVGTWNGGLARYATPSGRVRPFDAGAAAVAPLSVRSITATPRHVFVGTLQGLSVYSKASGRWRQLPPFDAADVPDRISAVVAVGPDVYVATLGRGLWRSEAGRAVQSGGGGWQRVEAGESGLPGPHLNTLLVDDNRIWIGTQDLGVVMLDTDSQRLTSFDRINPLLGPRNVTDIVAGHGERLWVATFGEGLFRWDAGANRITHHSVAEGSIPDDWVMAGARTPHAMYFGTFGGGVARFDATSERWSNIGLGEGLPSLDVSVVAHADGVVYFGTLGSGVAALSERRAAPVLVGAR